jgi:sugar lactone lactonase YvrE
VAGHGYSASYSGGVPALSVSLSQPRDVVVDKSGNLFISDTYNHVIRRVDPSGGIQTVAGVIGQAGFSGDGGPATSAALDGPWRLALDDNGNLFIADMYNNRIRKVDSNGIITTYAGSGGFGYGTGGFSGDGGPPTSARLRGPLGVALDASGNLYISDNNRIRYIAAPVKPSAAPVSTTTRSHKQSSHKSQSKSHLRADVNIDVHIN